jgi:aspartyl-tRNA(Asn)/glutamyl-tRNA(Gln) amidotransferase subunit C
MPVEIDIARVARLARLDLSPEDLEFYRTQLGVILEHAARVQTQEGEPHTGSPHPLRLTNVYRDDEVRPSLDRDEVLGQAAESIDGYFAAPPAMESE